MHVTTDLNFTFDIIDFDIYCSRRPRIKAFHHIQFILGKALSFKETYTKKFMMLRHSVYIVSKIWTLM